MTITLMGLEIMEALCKLDLTPERRRIWRDKKIAPDYAVSAGRNWAWLLWQKSKDIRLVRKEMKRIVGKWALTPARLAEAEEEGCRGRMDWFSLVCAIISSDDSQIKFAAESAVFARKTREPAPFFQVVSGVLKARILGDRKEELKQFALLDKQQPDVPDIGPAISLVKVFVERNYDELDKEVKRGVKRHWSDRYIGTKRGRSVIVEEGREHMTIDIGKKALDTLWAHSEAVFAKLAMSEGAQIKTDDVWFPLELISAPIV